MAQHDAQMTGAEILLKALVDQGVEVIFGYPGGVVLPIYDELFKQNRLRHILVRHEQAAVHAAEGYARSTGRVGCVLVTSGPGATNTITGLTDALMDSVPLVCITGQVPTNLIGNDAFQEADITGITRPCTKHNYLVKKPDDLARTVHEAFHVAKSGRPGPVVIDLPKDVITGRGEYQSPSKLKTKYKPQVKGDLKAIEKAAEMIAAAKRPVFYVGGGVVNSGVAACQLLTQFVRMTGYPCTQTLMGLGAFPASDPLSVGMLGMHGTYEANLAMHGADLIINVGARFDDRITGRLKDFAPTAKKIHIDIDPSSVNKNVMVDLAVIGDAAHILEDLIKVWKAKQCRPHEKALKEWWATIEGWRGRNCLHYENSNKIIKPQYAIQRLYELTKYKNPYITTEVGQHQMWAAQHFKFEQPCHWMTSGGLGTMGYGLPAAMGVQVAYPNALVIDIAGESSIQMNIQEMATLCQHRLPVKVFILNNQYMGMVRQWQELIHGGRYSESHMEHHPDFVKLADAFGAVGLRATKPSEVDDVIKEMLAVDRPVIVDVRTDASENCFPMIMPGMAHNEMVLGPEENVRVEPGSDEGGMVLV
ncbi:Acetolactate synthase large subunit (AHAS) (Acetohydroxy-acid synthase large subunit) (ALS) [Magnetospirillum gryphiswaldense MSR-1 v2]|uniref:Acetolactate synthase n=1 Tax=Magnetospirillum gryphiswaldense (strain DSM 6361 / JCM 21280 / NBRC 15271 / MSR-1) TaxID=431944 RepID=V6EZK7_MAGGM|nr:acetolactate synthase 3 large subunit [Magnetospirillum gryphiswaldense]CDK97658.1 Acetolactate synthase large subunit (AHAS) (Acetohydroxy-acid synthase large subunit) (ALS) [Magnetospirillum gryphiswaldense MSR-1 v2]